MPYRNRGIDRRSFRRSRSKGPSLKPNEKGRNSAQRLSSDLDSGLGCFECGRSTIDSYVCGTLGSFRRWDFVVCHWRLVLRRQKTQVTPSVSLPHGYVSDYEFLATASALHLPSRCLAAHRDSHGSLLSPPNKFFILKVLWITVSR